MTPPRDRVRPFLWAIGAFAVLHHADHVLRADNSGWPFQPEVTPFTFSLLVYPALLTDYLVRNKPWLRVGLLSAGLASLFLVHVTVERPADLFYTWATGESTTEHNPGMPNLLELASPVMGLAAVFVLTLLGAALGTTLALAVRQALAGFRFEKSSRLLEVD